MGIQRIVFDKFGTVKEIVFLPSTDKVILKGDAFARLRDGSQVRCTVGATFAIYGSSAVHGGGCTAVKGNLIGLSDDDYLKSGFTLVLTPKTFTCS